MKNPFTPKKLGVVCAALALALPAAAADAQKVTADKSGSIFYFDAAGKRTRLTHDDKDSDPCLDSTGKRIAYVHEVSGKPIPTGSGNVPPCELRLMDIDGKNQEVLVRSAGAENPEDTLADFATPQFSPDGNLIYFCSAAYATSGAIHVYDRAKKTVRFLIAGNNPQVVPVGDYKGDLLVEQHRYFLGGGSYDWYFLFEPGGKEVGPVGETTDNFREMYFEQK